MVQWFLVIEFLGSLKKNQKVILQWKSRGKSLENPPQDGRSAGTGSCAVCFWGARYNTTRAFPAASRYPFAEAVRMRAALTQC